MEEIKIVPKIWGREIWMANTDLYCGKKLILFKGKRCSLHYHKNKDETFYIDSGEVLMEIEGDEKIMKEGEAVLIKPGVKHRFSGLKDSMIIEISTHHEDSDSYREEGELSGDVPKEIMEKYTMKNKAIFLDRDGTINVDVGYTHKLKDLKIIPGVIEGLRKLQKAGYGLIIVTNQSGIGRGYYTEEDYHNFQLKLRQELNKQGVFITGEYFCPHHPKEAIGEYLKDCNCRKPKTGMLEQASKDFDIDVDNSWVIGDKTDDIEMGKRAGCKTILVKTGKAGEDRHFSITPTFIASNLLEAANYIINDKKE